MMRSRCLVKEQGRLHSTLAVVPDNGFRGLLAPPISISRSQADNIRSEKNAVTLLAKSCSLQGSALPDNRSVILQNRSRAAVALLQQCADNGDVMRAEAWMRTMLCARACKHIRMFNTVILACARVADVRRAEHWFFQIIEHKLEPNVYTFNMLLKACAEAGDLVAAHRWMFRMFDVSLFPDAVTFRTLIHTCAKKQNPQLAEEWLVKMQAASHPLDVISCSAVMNAYAMTNDRCGVERWLGRMQEDGVLVDEVGYSVMIHMWATGSANLVDDADNKMLGFFPPSPELAESWLWKSMEAGYRPTSKALHSLLDSFLQLGDTAGVERIEQVMQEITNKPVATVCALKSKAHSASGDYHAVENLISNLRDQGGRPDMECLRLLLASYARSQRSPWDRAELCFRELYELGAFDVSRSSSYSFANQQQLLKDLRDAVGRNKFAALSAEFALPRLSSLASEPRLRRRVVGRCEMISPAEESS